MSRKRENKTFLSYYYSSPEKKTPIADRPPASLCIHNSHIAVRRMFPTMPNAHTLFHDPLIKLYEKINRKLILI